MAHFDDDDHHEHSLTWAEAELAFDVSRREVLVRAVVEGDLTTVRAMVEADHALAFHTLNRKTTLLVRWWPR